MSDKRDGFLFYRSYYEAAKALPQRMKAAFLMSLCAYVFDGVEPALKGTAQSAWILTKPTIDANARRRANRKKETEKRGAEDDRWSTDGQPVDVPMPSEIKDRRQEKKDEGKEIQDERQETGDAAREGGSAPGTGRVGVSLSEVKDFVSSQGGTLRQAETFHAQYERAHWMAGGMPIQNWKGLCRNFLSAGGGTAPPLSDVPEQPPDEQAHASYRVPPRAKQNARDWIRILQEEEARERGEAKSLP